MLSTASFALWQLEASIFEPPDFSASPQVLMTGQDAGSEELQRRLSGYKRSLSSVHILIGFFESRGVGMEVERGIELNLARNVEGMERSGSWELVEGTEMLFASIAPRFEDRLQLFDAEIGREGARIAHFYGRIDGLEDNPVIAYQQVERLSSGVREAGTYLEKARADADNARSSRDYGDLLFFASSAASDLDKADSRISDANAGLDRVLEFSGYKKMVLGLALKGVLLLAFLGALLYLAFQMRGKWRVVESSGGFHYKKRW